MSLVRYSKTALACVVAFQLVAVGQMAQAQAIAPHVVETNRGCRHLGYVIAPSR